MLRHDGPRIRPGPGGAAGTGAPVQAWRVLAVADFGGSRDGGLQGLTLRGGVPAGLPGEMGVTAAFEVPNLLGSSPDPIAVQVAVQRFGDLSGKAVQAAAEPLRRAAALRDAVAGGLRDFGAYPDLDRVAAAVGSLAIPPRTRPVAPDATSDVDRLLSMLDLSAPSSQAGPVLPAPAPSLRDAAAVIDRMMAEQLALLRGHPRWTALEAAWRGLLLLVGRPGLPSDVQVDIVDAADPALCLLRDLAPDELEQPPGARPACILVGGAAAGTAEGLGHLALCAAAGAALQVPVIASLRQDAFDHPDPAFTAGWELLRQEEGAAWLAVCLGDPVLGAEGRAGPLWGEPAWAVAALAVQSVARTGSPSLLADPSTVVLEGLDVHEVPGRAGPAAWPLRRPASRGDAAALAAAGVVPLLAQANRDRVFLGAAPCLAPGVDLAAQLAAAQARTGAGPQAGGRDGG